MNFNNNENTLLHNLNPKEATELISRVNNFTPEYRACLDFSAYFMPNITFGVELEYENAIEFFISNYISRNYPLWEAKTDDSLINGGELASPILTDTPDTWSELSEICTYLNRKHVLTSKNAACHIHVGAHLLGSDISNWLTFLKIYTIYEPVIIHFALGDKPNYRAGFNHYAYPTSNELQRTLTILNSNSRMIDLMYYLPNQSRNQSLNFKNFDYCNPGIMLSRNTLEFRSPHGTTNEIVIQNYLNTFTKLILCPQNPYLDEDFLNDKLKNFRTNPRKPNYHIINLREAFEFVDLIFTNNLDKAYFLYQYLNNFANFASPPARKLLK